MKSRTNKQEGIKMGTAILSAGTPVSIFSLAFVFVISSTAHAGLGKCAYDRESAITYASNWTQTGSDVHNPAYTFYYGEYGDCANFASQCLIAGGLDMESLAPPSYLAGPTGYMTIPNVGNLSSFLTAYSYNGSQVKTLTIYTDPDNVPTPISLGDIVTFAVAKTNYTEWHHSAVVVKIIRNVNDPDHVWAGDIYVDSHSTTNNQHDKEFYLSGFWNSAIWPEGHFFHIQKTGQENTEVCLNTGESGCQTPPCCGQALQKTWAPTAAD